MEALAPYFTFILGLITGVIGSISGGAGLITIPGLVLLGLPAEVAIATTRFSAGGLNLSGAAGYHLRRKIDYSVALPTMLMSVIGAYFGAKLLLAVPSGDMQRIAGVCLLVALLVILRMKDVGLKVSSEKTPLMLGLGLFSFLVVGFWGAFVGGGYAILAIYSYIVFYGRTFTQCAGDKMVAGLGISLVAILIYGPAGIIDWWLGSFLLLGNVIGAYVGAHTAIRRGDRFIRGFVIVIVGASAVKLLFFS